MDFESPHLKLKIIAAYLSFHRKEKGAQLEKYRGSADI